jgi:UDP-N-acetylmuramoyl-tripeptide--D-alanyl-D-alanine ligase
MEAIQSRAEDWCVRFSTADLATHLGGTLVGPDVAVDGASIDSRSVGTGQLFIPIVAERDGHDFIAVALAAGAPAYLTEREPVGATAVVVANTGRALTQLGALARRRLSADVLGITGSVGKTTTKDLVNGCLSSTYRTVATARSFNNELGVPLTLANAADDAQWLVLEMGARGVGHIAELAELIRPRVGIVTSVGRAHIEFFGDLEGVVRAKSELITSLPPDGLAVLNADDERVARMGALAPCPVLTYGLSAADVTADGVTLNEDLQASFTLQSPWGSGPVTLRLHGAVQVSNALAAATSALWSGVSLNTVLGALSEVGPSDMRMDVRHPATGPAVIVDCYNANPLSTEAALRSLAQLGHGTKVALLGRMAELGDETVDQHQWLADLGRQLGLTVVGYRTDLYGPEQVDTVDAAVALFSTLDSGDAVLVKGSRVAQLEDVVHAYGAAIGDASLLG